MFYNIGTKLKIIAKRNVVFSVIVAIIAIIVCAALFADSSDVGPCFLGILIAIIYYGSAVFVSYLIYGFGELIEKTVSIDEKLGFQAVTPPRYTAASAPGAASRPSAPGTSAQPSAPSVSLSDMEKIKKLESLKNSKLITQAEYDKAMNDILHRG